MLTVQQLARFCSDNDTLVELDVMQAGVLRGVSVWQQAICVKEWRVSQVVCGNRAPRHSPLDAPVVGQQKPCGFYCVCSDEVCEKAEQAMRLDQ